jgi:fatty-acyl-CoA synthase
MRRSISRPWPAGRRARAVGPDVDATIVFTSGSTADPKGAVHTARARAAVEDAAVLGVGPTTTWGYMPFFAGGLVAVALTTLAAGGAVVLQEIFEPGETLTLLERERVTVFFAWPHQAEALIAHPRFATTARHLHKGVGANTKWAAAIYPPEHHATSSFGMTETPPLCCAWPWDAPQALRVSCHGPAVGSRELRICDPETGAPLPEGHEGEIRVRGPTLMRGYYKQDRAGAFDGDGYFRTGDVGRLDERGALHFVGRLKDVIKSGGANVAAAEVEAVLGAHPAVAVAYAIGVPDPSRGESVGVFVVPKGAVDADGLVAWCRERLASYKAPRWMAPPGSRAAAEGERQGRQDGAPRGSDARLTAEPPLDRGDAVGRQRHGRPASSRTYQDPSSSSGPAGRRATTSGSLSVPVTSIA